MMEVKLGIMSSKNTAVPKDDLPDNLVAVPDDDLPSDLKKKDSSAPTSDGSENSSQLKSQSPSQENGDFHFESGRYIAKNPKSLGNFKTSVPKIQTDEVLDNGKNVVKRLFDEGVVNSADEFQAGYQDKFAVMTQVPMEKSGELMEYAQKYDSHRPMIAQLAKNLNKDPKDYKSMNDLASIYDDLGDGSTAQSIYVQSLMTNENNPMAKWGLAGHELKAGNREEAKKDFYKLQEQHPDFTPATANLAFMESKDGNHEEAMRESSKLTKDNPKDSWSWLADSYIHSVGGDKKKAEELNKVGKEKLFWETVNQVSDDYTKSEEERLASAQASGYALADFFSGKVKNKEEAMLGWLLNPIGMAGQGMQHGLDAASEGVIKGAKKFEQGYATHNPKKVAMGVIDATLGVAEGAFATMMNTTPAGIGTNMALAPLPDEVSEFMFAPLEVDYTKENSLKEQAKKVANTIWGLAVFSAIHKGGELLPKPSLKDPEAFSQWKDKAKNQIGKMSMDDMKVARELYDKIPDNLSNTQVEKVLPWFAEYRKLSKEMEGVDELFQPAYKKQLSAIQKEIDILLTPKNGAEKIFLSNAMSAEEFTQAANAKNAELATPAMPKDGVKAPEQADGTKIVLENNELVNEPAAPSAEPVKLNETPLSKDESLELKKLSTKKEIGKLKPEEETRLTELDSRKNAGKPKLFNEPVPEVSSVLKKYKEDKKIDTEPGEPITEIDENRSKAIADEYEKMQQSPEDPKTKEAYEALVTETAEQHDALSKGGYKFELYEKDGEPYKNSEEMLRDLRDNKHLWVKSTEHDFGTTPITEKQRTENPLLKDSGRKDVNGKALLNNDVFRAVHDAFGHGERGNAFGAKGEENAWDVHSRAYSPLARRAMTTETRGQNSWVNFGKHMRNEDGSIKKKGEPGFLDATKRPYTEQKVGLLPEWVSELKGEPVKEEKIPVEATEKPVSKKPEPKPKPETKTPQPLRVTAKEEPVPVKKELTPTNEVGAMEDALSVNDVHKDVTQELIESMKKDGEVTLSGIQRRFKIGSSTATKVLEGFKENLKKSVEAESKKPTESELKADANEIAAKHGFDNSTHFLNAVKKYTGKEFSTVQDAILDKAAIKETKRAKKYEGAKEALFKGVDTFTDSLKPKDGDEGAPVMKNGWGADELNVFLKDVIEHSLKTAETIEGAIDKAIEILKKNFDIQEDLGMTEKQLKFHLKSAMADELFEKNRKKAVANRVYSGNTPKEIQDAVEKHGLTYDVERHVNAERRAEEFINEVGIDNAINAVRSNDVKGGAATFVWAKSIDILDKQRREETNPDKKFEISNEITNLVKEFDERYRTAGQEISALQAVYQIADFGYKHATLLNRAMKANEGKEVPKAVSDKLQTIADSLDDINKKIDDIEARIAAGEVSLEPVKPKARVALTEKKSARKNELAKKYRGVFNDVTNIAKSAFEKDFYEYAGLVLEEAGGDFKAWSTEMINSVGKGIKEHLSKLYEDITGENIVIQQRMKRLEKQLDDLRTGSVRAKKEVVPDTPEVKQLRDEIQKTKELLGYVPSKAMPKMERNEQQKIVDKLGKQIGDYEKKLSSLKDKSYSSKKKSDTPLEKEAFDLYVQKNKLKEQADVELEKLRFSNLPLSSKIANWTVDILGIPKSMVASADLSAPLRQGAVLSVRHPGIAKDSFKTMLDHAFSEQNSEVWMHKLKSSPEYYIMKKAGLYLAEPTARLTAKEEQFTSNLSHRIPGWGKGVVKPSERAYTGYLNKLRVDTFLQFHDALVKDGIQGERLEKELKSYAKFVNNASGRAGLGLFEEAGSLLNSFYFAPRYVLSRFNIIANPVFYLTMSPRARMEALRSTGTYIGVGMMVLATAKAAGADVELDPRSSDFGKIRIGNTRYDIWAGFQQGVRLISQLASGSKKTLGGDVKSLVDGGYGDETRGTVWDRFKRSKASPASSLTQNVMEGSVDEETGKFMTTDMVGGKHTISDEALNLVMPLWSRDIAKIYQEGGFDEATFAALSSFFGVGVQNFSPEDIGDIDAQEPEKTQVPTRKKVYRP